ncbi:unnamed protein product [Caenorhabditis brenneri]
MASNRVSATSASPSIRAAGSRTRSWPIFRSMQELRRPASLPSLFSVRCATAPSKNRKQRGQRNTLATKLLAATNGKREQATSEKSNNKRKKQSSPETTKSCTQ